MWGTVVFAFLLLVTALAPFGAAAGFMPVAWACGVERWSVKTLSDADAPRINLEALPSTVSELASQPAPSVEELRQHADSRIDDLGDPPIELSTYTVRVMLLQFKTETDEDIHLVIADADDPSQTMIAEFPT